MKKTFLIAFVILSGMAESFSQRNTTAPEIDQFLASPEFSRVISDPMWSRLGPVTRSLCYVTAISEDTKEVKVNIVFQNSRNNKITAVVEAIRVPSGRYLMPSNEKYAMALRDYENYDFANTSGVIEYYDLNYKNHHAGTITISKSSVTSWLTYDIPEDILNQDPQVIKKTHYCDKNQNGNVTFTECYSCMKGACDGHPDCSTLCELINLVNSYCTKSFVAACIYISMWW